MTDVLFADRRLPILAALGMTDDYLPAAYCRLPIADCLLPIPRYDDQGVSLKKNGMAWTFDDLLTVTFSLFAIIDIVGSVPLLISIKERLGGIHELKVTLLSGLLMILFVFLGEQLLKIFGLDVSSFAVGGSIVIFILGLEMVLGVEFFKSESDPRSGTLVPIAFPLIAGSGTLTTIVSLRANYDKVPLLIAIGVNLIIVYLTLRSLKYIARLLGPSGLTAVRKFFGVVLLAIAVKIFTSNVGSLIK